MKPSVALAIIGLAVTSYVIPGCSAQSEIEASDLSNSEAAANAGLIAPNSSVNISRWIDDRILEGPQTLEEYSDSHLEAALVAGYDPFGGITPMTESRALWPNCLPIQVNVIFDYRLTWDARPVLETETRNVVGTLNELTGLQLNLPPEGSIRVIDRPSDPDYQHIDVVWVSDTTSPVGEKQEAYANVWSTEAPGGYGSITRAQVFLPAEMVAPSAKVEVAASAGNYSNLENYWATLDASQLIYATLLHEMGHTVGLGHNPIDTSSIMAPRHNDLTSITVADRSAFKHTGSLPCEEAALTNPPSESSVVVSDGLTSSLGLHSHEHEEEG